MTCKGTCSRYKVDPQRGSRGTRYSPGIKYCSTCSVRIKYDGQYCPCCHIQLRTKRRLGTHTAKRLRDLEIIRI